jgi:hypothetical protein
VVAATYSRSRGFDHSPTLNGMAWLEHAAPADGAAIRWLRRHQARPATVLEAVGPDFDPAGSARFSTFTGLPTVLGWGGHEVQWGHKPAGAARTSSRSTERAGSRSRRVCSPAMTSTTCSWDRSSDGAIRRPGCGSSLGWERLSSARGRRLFTVSMPELLALQSHRLPPGDGRPRDERCEREERQEVQHVQHERV